MQPSELKGLRSLRGLVVDMDGVLWHGNTPLPGLSEFFRVLRARNIRFVLATNNNTESVDGFVRKAQGMGVELTSDEVVTASLCTLKYLQERHPNGARVYVIGEPAFKEMLAAAGYILADHDVAAVITTLDRHLSYDMLKTATLLLNKGAEFIGPNPDASYPAEEGMIPGAGAVLAALSAATGRQPVIMGKPESWIFRMALDRMNLGVEETASVGDRLTTDIEGGRRMGMRTILLMSGVTTPAERDASPIKPTWVFDGITPLSAALDA